MDRRIFGIENEYGVTCTFDGQRRLTPDEVARYLFRKVVSWGRSSNVFLANGSRLYLDVGSHPEYATPECDDVRLLVTHDKAGERIVEGLVADAQHRIADEGIAGEIYVFKNNTDSAGNSYGCHENYLVGRAGEFQRLSDILIPFLVSRQIICGAGKITTTARGATYCLSQRADHIWEGVSSATTRSRPIINTRDEPHADAEKYRRLHVIVGDSNMSETTTMLKVGSADLVLRMFEAGVSMPDLTLENPIRAIREISHDLTGRKKVKLADGRELSAVQIQTEYYERAAAFVVLGLDLYGAQLATVSELDLLAARQVMADLTDGPDRVLQRQVRHRHTGLKHPKHQIGRADLEHRGRLAHVGIAHDDMQPAVLLGVGVRLVPRVDDGPRTRGGAGDALPDVIRPLT